jgi:hypothetical protein
MTRQRAAGIAVVAGLVAFFGLRLGLVWARSAPLYFPDEYLYAALGRSLAGLNAPTVRGQSAHFFALLEPILTAPAWLAGDLDTGYRIVQAIGAAAMTLTAVPAYLLARRVGLSKRIAAALSILAIVVPDMVYAGFVTSEPFAYPLVIAASAAAVYAFAAPNRANQVTFLTLAGLAAFTRVQLALLPLCFAGAVVVIGVSEGSFRRVVREQRLPLAAIAVGLCGAAAVVASQGLGLYGGAAHIQLAPTAVIHSSAANLTILSYASGWVLIPGAFLGVVLSVVRPRTRAERGLGAMTLTLGTGLLLQAAIWGDTTMVQERYVFYVIPLVAICFGLYAARGFPHRRLHAVLALGLLLLAVRVPLSEWAQPGLDDHSPLLLGVQTLGSALGNIGNGAIAVMIVATVFALLAAAAPWLPRARVALLLGVAIAGCTAEYAAVWHLDRDASIAQARRSLPPDRSWVDDAHVGSTTLLTGAGGPADEMQLFWNRSIDRVALLPGGEAPDQLASERVSVAANGTLLASGNPIRGAMLVGRSESSAVLRGARRVESTPGFTLWLPRAAARLRLLFQGRGRGGTLAVAGRITLWPRLRRLAGWVEFNAIGLAGKPLHLDVAGRHVTGGRIQLRVCSTGAWTVAYGSRSRNVAAKLVAGRIVIGHATMPVFHPDATACSGRLPGARVAPA